MPHPIAAIVYSGGIYPDRLICSIVATLEARGIVLAGMVQRDETMPGRPRCSMALEELGKGLPD
jgi:hypothetical protein